MNIIQFGNTYPQFVFDFEQAIGAQARIFEDAVLEALPVALDANFAYRSGGRGRPNRNQTRTHSQCATCKRVLRNDQFYTPPSMMRRNVVYSHCKTCAQTANAERYTVATTLEEARRNAIWSYLAPRCAHCGFDQHPSAMDLHLPKGQETHISALITELAAAPDAFKAEILLHEAKAAMPLCSNCHRMVHAGVIQISPAAPTRAFNLVDLLATLEACAHA
jgi:hypothetical protein